MKKNFYEINVTNFSEAHLKRISHTIVTNKNCNGWNKIIDNLEMVLIDDEIFVRGWATPKNWNKLCKDLVNDRYNINDYIYMNM